MRWIAGSKSGNDLHGRRAADCQRPAPRIALLQQSLWGRMYFEMKKAGECPAFFLLPRRGLGVGQFNLKNLVEEGEQVNIFVHTQVALVFP